MLTALYNAALYLSTGFLGTYKLKELALSVGAVQLINIAANLCRFAVSRPMGRYSDRTSFARGALLALCITAAGFALNIFAAPGAWFFAVPYTVLYAVGQAGLSQNMVNMAFNYVPVDYFVHATAIKNSIGGICGFTASLLGGWLLDESSKTATRSSACTFTGSRRFRCCRSFCSAPRQFTRAR